MICGYNQLMCFSEAKIAAKLQMFSIILLLMAYLASLTQIYAERHLTGSSFLYSGAIKIHWSSQ